MRAFESPDLGGVKLVKTWTARRGAYHGGQARSRQHRHCRGRAAAVPATGARRQQAGGRVVVLFTFTGPAVYTEDKKYQKVEFKDIEANKADFRKDSDNGYVAMVQHYFASAWLLPGAQARNLHAQGGRQPVHGGMITPLGDIAPGASKAQERAVCGPQEEKNDGKAGPRPGTGQGLWLA